MRDDGQVLTYHTYLRLAELLSLQDPLTPSDAESLFITVHQCIELLWKEALKQLDCAIEAMQTNLVADATAKILRATRIISASTSVATLLNTMTTLEFAEFRKALGTASGLQSSQFRELEIQAGLSGSSFLSSYATQSVEYIAVRNRLDGTTLRAEFFGLLERNGVNEFATACSKTSLTDSNQEQITQAINRLYRDPQFRDLANTADALYSYDEAFAMFRWEHFQLVQRIIGSTNGTGGTSLEYLQRKLLRRFFPELVTSRTDIFS